MADSRPRIVVAGESLVDRIVRPSGAVDEQPGGGPFNTARVLAALGCRVAFAGRLSTDARGRRLRRLLEEEGVELDLAPRTDEPTLVATATVAADGATRYDFEPPGSAADGLRPSDLPTGLPPSTIALHVGTLGLVLEPTATTIAGLVVAAPPAVLVLLDPNIRPAAIADASVWRARFRRVLERADVIRASVDDLRWLEPDREPSTVARALLDAGPRVVLLTDGANPVRIVMPGAEESIAVPERPVVDTIGAGDAFGAGFLAAWLRAGRGRPDLEDRETLRVATRFAVEVASRTVAHSGAGPPDLSSLQASMPVGGVGCRAAQHGR